ncbi:MAG: BlaI/MecI/CopY family transcriptional regulator [Simkania sp.]|nr:BlaI/MecI/CopY family transcriptional regulator [Simkania sp.]MCP5491137.1 BlaI/MecI/CopY family transcriptional regulator [Chlamydiales bacterium]
MKRKQFGELEDSVISLFLKKGCPLSVREIHSALGKGRAYTTFLTVVSRLYQKGVLSRQKEGRGYLYLLKKAKENTLFQKIKNSLLTASPVQVLSFFFDHQKNISQDEIEQIEEMIQNYKRKQK